ncbi:MAG: S-adenosylmethionine/tRNA-ribosyltransferase-isomerase [Chthoniobacter sp.]|nr:S-adenosylmethionine/tRNA-ribosyltransferase-isomerase [Chthoniobacter sp.]
MSFRTADYDFVLPDDLIARYPLARREDSRMLVLHRAEQRIEHRHFVDFPSYLRPDDLVVLNDTRVIPARVFSDDRRIELLFLQCLREHTWECLVKPGRKMRLGAVVEVRGVPGTVIEILPEGERVIAFASEIDLDAAGELPLPPYFGRAVEPSDAERYQTVFAREQGAVAAPTAGLHFTPEILSRVPHTFITLHVGVGTFRGVHEADLRAHRMHAERFIVSTEAAAKINAAARVLAVGTTTARVLESQSRPVQAGSGTTDIFIHPPYEPRNVGALLTNFHLPQSTLLMLVAALAGREFTLAAYAEAVRERYRFYSYGDCMLVL